MPTIDERLLGASQQDKQRQQEAAYADQLRQEQMKAADQNRQAEDVPSLRQRVQAARQTLDLKQRAKDKVKEKVAAPAKLATGRALQWAWISLIPSWGLSLIYINMHVFLRWIFPDAFCKLGEEWLPKQAAALGGEAGKTIGKGIGIVEIMGLLAIDFAILFVLFGVVVLMVWLYDNVAVKVFNLAAIVVEWIVE